MNTSSSVSAPLRCSRMAMRLDQGQAPGKEARTGDVQARRGHWPPAGTSQEAGAALTPRLVHGIDSTDEQQSVGLCVLHKHQEQLQRRLHHQAKLGQGMAAGTAVVAGACLCAAGHCGAAVPVPMTGSSAVGPGTCSCEAVMAKRHWERTWSRSLLLKLCAWECRHTRMGRSADPGSLPDGWEQDPAQAEVPRYQAQGRE